MRTRHIALLLTALMAGIASCSVDPERHELTPVSPTVVHYADQQLDSAMFYTTDSWKATPQCDWITLLTDAEMTVTYNYYKRYLCGVKYMLPPNTTGRSRYGKILIASGEYSYLVPVVQLGLIEVSHPSFTTVALLDGFNSTVPDTAYYALKDSAHWTADSLCFNAREYWSLSISPEATWVTASKTKGDPGKYRVDLTLQPNTDTEQSRSTELKLTSGSVTNTITLTQLKAESKTEGGE